METTMILYHGLVFLSTIFLLHLLSKRLLGSRRSLNFPPRGPLPLPVIGHLHLLKQPIHHTLTRFSAAYGPVLLLRFGSRPVLLVSSPSAAEECFTKNDVIFANRPLLLTGKHLSYNHSTLGAACYGPHWRNLRRFTTLEIFSTARTAALSSIRAGEVRALLRQLFRSSSAAANEFQRVDMKTKLFELTTNMIMQMIAGKRYYGESGTAGHEEGRRFKRIIEEVLYLSGASSPEDFIPLMRWMGMNGLKKRMVKLERELDELLHEMVDERRRKRQWSEEATGGEKKKTMVDVMISLQETDPGYYTDELIKGVLLVSRQYIKK